MDPVRVMVWNEYRCDREDPEAAALYPGGIHAAIADHLHAQEGVVARTATLDEPEHGLTAEALDHTDVLIWWAHRAHREVSDEVVERVASRVRGGMGLMVLHSGHYAKVLQVLLGTSCRIQWENNGGLERLWVVDPDHPVTAGVGPSFELPRTEMYGEPFVVPSPDEVLLISWFESGQVFRSGCVWRRGDGKVFYFRPGHETYAIYHDERVMRVITNAVYWLAGR